jgi:hypothetical protein
MNVLQMHWMQHRSALKPYRRDNHCVVPPIQCADGFTMSVQASACHYCSPRAMLEDGAYTAWEVWHASDYCPILFLLGHDVDDEGPLECVPTEHILACIRYHGGLTNVPAVTQEVTS